MGYPDTKLEVEAGCLAIDKLAKQIIESDSQGTCSSTLSSEQSEGLSFDKLVAAAEALKIPILVTPWVDDGHVYRYKNRLLGSVSVVASAKNAKRLMDEYPHMFKIS